MGNLIDISEVCASTGLPASTLHYYERHQLIASAGRNGLRRQYEPGTIDQLAVITLCQRAGFSLDEVRAILATAGAPGWKGFVEIKLAELRRRIEVLTEIEHGLEHALLCPSENVMQCEHFRAELTKALPVDPSERARRASPLRVNRG